jgi:hypothetical protein
MARRLTLKESYFLWLYNLIGDQRRSYKKLSGILHKKIFRWFIHNDDNRCEDGLTLRSLYIEENNLDESHLEVSYFLKGDCTIFELMVALSQRLNELTYDLDTHDNTTSKWFLEMLRNLRLARFSDDSSPYVEFDGVADAEINEILEVLIDRTYGCDGKGSLFPVTVTKSDMSTTEIWYQMMAYLEEHYG